MQGFGAAIVALCRSVAQQSCRWFWRAGPSPKQSGSTGSRSRRCRAGAARYRAEGDAAFEARSRRPRTTPAAIPAEVVELVVNLRAELESKASTRGPHTIAWHLQQHHQIAVSPSTIRRRLAERGLVEPNPKKRPRSSYVRFEADLPNQMWQSDFCHWRLSGESAVEIITWLDDHSRYRALRHRPPAHHRPHRRRNLRQHLR